uniref:Uncharacterized protein n=2 Tax=Schizaphis graminum TaxID=13262 RepID=A0A2S2PFL9_SCHGA
MHGIIDKRTVYFSPFVLVCNIIRIATIIILLVYYVPVVRASTSCVIGGASFRCEYANDPFNSLLPDYSSRRKSRVLAGATPAGQLVILLHRPVVHIIIIVNSMTY